MLSILKILSLIFLVFPLYGQEIYKSTDVTTRFYSSAPIEDIAAQADDGLSLWNTRTGEISFRVNIRSFQFEKGKMQEHFNENFMESRKYPHATFKGEIRNQPDLSQEGSHQVTLVGILEIHGVKKNREVPAEIRIQGENLNLESEFEVAVADHDIEIPKILWRNIAEEVRVTLRANYSKLDP